MSPRSSTAWSSTGPWNAKAERHLAALAFLLDQGIELAEEADFAFVAEPHTCRPSPAVSRAHEGAPASAVDAPVQRRFDRGSTAPRPMRRPLKRAGITLVSFTTSASPGCSKSGRSRTPRSSQSGRARPHDQEPRRIARDDRPQRDPLGRQVEIEEVRAHARYTGMVLRSATMA